MFSRKASGSKKVSLVAGLLVVAASASAFTASASAHGLGHARGDLITRGPATKVVARGPIALHAYSGYAGGVLYGAPAVTGTDQDCVGITPTRGAVLPADRVTTFVVPAGEVVCLKTVKTGSFELLWHTAPTSTSTSDTASELVLASSGR